MSAPVRGWLFDVYPAEEGMVLWFLDADGRPPRRVVRGARPQPLRFPLAVRQAAALRDLTLYTCDLSTAQLFLYERELFPLGEYDLVVDDGGLRGAIPRSRPEDLEY